MNDKKLKIWVTTNDPVEMKSVQDDLRNVPLNDLVGDCVNLLNLSQHQYVDVLRDSVELVCKHTKRGDPHYHDIIHSIDVLLAFVRLSPHELQDRDIWILGMIAAILHDIGHPGGNNTSPYELEANSVNIIKESEILKPLGKNSDMVYVAIMDTAFQEAGDIAKNKYFSGDKLSAILRHADIFRSVYINADAALEMGEKLQKEFENSYGRCPKLKEMSFVKEMGSPIGQINFGNMNPSYLLSKEGIAMDERRIEMLKVLKKILSGSVF